MAGKAKLIAAVAICHVELFGKRLNQKLSVARIMWIVALDTTAINDGLMY